MAHKLLLKNLESKRAFKRLCGGSRDEPGMRCGLVILKSGKSVGSHCAHGKEEALILLRGKAKIFCGKKSLIARAGAFVYIPENAVHDVKNAGRGALKYIYVTSRIK